MDTHPHLVIDAIEQTRHNREEGWLESFNVVHKERDVSLVEPYSGPVAEHGDL